MIRVLDVIETERDVPAARADTAVLVLDPAWTPMPDGRADVLAARPLFGAVVERRDLFDEALERVDAWADRSAAADRLTIDGVTYWFRMRETMWRWLHERLLWRYALASIGADGRAMTFRIPANEEALRDVAARLGTIDRGAQATAPVAEPPSRAATIVPDASWRRAARGLRRLARAPFAGPAGSTAARAAQPVEPRLAKLTERLERLMRSDRPRVVVLTTPATHQRVASDGASRDPILGSVIDQLEDGGFEPVLMAIGTDPRRDEDWSILAADERMLPGSMLASRWGLPDDRRRADRAVSTIGAAAESLRGVPLDVDGVDLTDAFVDALRDRVVHVVRNDVVHQARVERLIAEVRPSAILLAQEGIRVPWLAAGRDGAVPVFAVQHGILYAGHPGYPHRRHAAVARATKTFVYGTFERDMLLERGAYLPDEVEVSGSPRLDLDDDGAPAQSGGTSADARSSTDRDAVRAELGVKDGDRLLVVATVNLPFVQRAHFAPMVDRLLGGPLERVHVVFKLHPGEREDGPYRALLEGAARARGHDAPPISVVRDIDLYRLLRAADAHLGLHSTVLTDAVAAGTPNLIATVDAHADILGYGLAGVARPIGDVRDVLEALDAPAPPDPAARAAFLARHFRDGHAGARIAAAIRDVVDDSASVAGRAKIDHAGRRGRGRPAAGARVIAVRRATEEDAERLHAWANDPVTRAAGFQPSPIDQRTHGLWLEERLASPTTRLFVGLDGDEPVGQVRLAADPDGRVEVGISVAPEARGRGIGRSLLDAGLAAGLADPDLHIEDFVARIRPDNAASLALFVGAGFRLAGTDEVGGIACLVYERAAG